MDKKVKKKQDQQRQIQFEYFENGDSSVRLVKLWRPDQPLSIYRKYP
jgi:hypothetical protein